MFPRPYEFDPAGWPNSHLAFGIGAHRCIGGPPAQVALGILIEELLERVERFELAEEVNHLRSNFINGITHLPVRFHTGGRYGR
jgi:cytochrome P450